MQSASAASVSAVFARPAAVDLMRVVIRFGHGPKVGPHPRRQDPTVLLAAGALLTLAAVAAGVLGLWRIAADLDLTSDFAISSGFFSHWQVWIAAAVLLEVGSRFLQRHARRQSAATPPQEDAARGQTV
jgi:hypothetical protein